MNKTIIAAIALTSFSVTCLADEALDTDIEKYSYAVGFSIGQQIKAQLSRENTEWDADALTSAIRDVMNDADSALSEEDMQAVMKTQQEAKLAERKALAYENLKKGEAFLAENKAKEGVVTTEGGVQYKVLQEGEGKQPTAEDTVVVHYRGTLTDGTEFDSSYKRDQPATFSLGGIIKGWQEVLPLMKEGSKWEAVIPAAMAYGENGAGNAIGPNETLVFEIELIEVK